MLHALLRDGAVDKRYSGLVKGRWRRASLAIEAPLLKRRGDGEARVKVDPRGKAAKTVFRLLERARDLASLLEIELATGRTHQIRVHAAHLGHPLAGDDRYGDREFNERMAGYGLRRLFLHAFSVRFTWPDTGEPFSVSAPLPAELANVLTALELAPGRARADRNRPS
jgi:23S rRNA pseudouridine955/2504/2580 synthase